MSRQAKPKLGEKCEGRRVDHVPEMAHECRRFESCCTHHRWNVDHNFSRLAVTRAPGARHASVRFVSGALDRVEGRAAFLDLARRENVPMLVIYGDQTPPRSRAEMEAFAGVPDTELKLLPHGKLAIHEEFPESVAATIGSSLIR